METETTDIVQEDAPERGTRKLLYALIGVLGAAAIGLLILLLMLLGDQEPDPIAEGPGGTIKVSRAIYGFGTGADQLLKNPMGVGFDDVGNVWISDTGNSRVLVFTSKGDFVRRVGTTEGPGAMSSPYGITPDPKRDRMYIADWTARRVLVYSTSGRYVESLPAADQKQDVFGPNGFTPYEVRLLNDQVLASSNDGLYLFDRTGHVVKRIGGKGAGRATGQFNFPDAFDVSKAGDRIFVADTLNRRIVALDAEGRWLWVSGKPDEGGKIAGFWQLPRGLAVAPDGKVFVVDTFRFSSGKGAGHIVVLSPEGALLAEFGAAGKAENQFNFPEKIAFGPDGLIAIADRENNRVVLVSSGALPKPNQQEVQMYSVVKVDVTPSPSAS